MTHHYIQRTKLEFYRDGGMACISIRIEALDLDEYIHHEIVTFPACGHGECLFEKLVEAVMTIPKGIMNSMIKDNHAIFIISAPHGIAHRGIDISGEDMQFIPTFNDGVE